MPISRRRALAMTAAGATAPLLGCASTVGAAGAAPATAFQAFADSALRTYVQLRPVEATLLGDHRFDAEIDDASASGRAARAAFYRETLAALDAYAPAQLSPADRVDADILKNQLQLDLWTQETLQAWAWDPLPYNQQIGSSLYGLVAREFAPLPERLNNAAARMEKLPALLAQARANLDPARVPKVHADTWSRQNAGLASLVDGQILAQADALGPQDRARLVAAAEAFKAAVAQTQAFIDQTLAPATQGEFRYGPALYDQKLAFSLNSPLSRDEIRTRALAAKEAILQEMAEVAGQVVSPPANERWTRQRMIAMAMERVAAVRPTPEELVATCRRTLDESTAFVRAHDLITLPDAPVNVIVMPEFQRGVAVAYCDPPGALERHLPTFYAVSPIPAQWTAQQAESFLREYNTYAIHEITVHEAMPGHYVQLWHSNRYPSAVRSAFYSGPFVEGWANYAQDVMLEAGYQAGDPLQRLAHLKINLRSVTNALLDIGIHIDGIDRDEAMRLMTEDAFQEEREAAGKWVRACVTAGQLCTYFVGQTEHHATRAEAQARWGADFSLKRYHDSILSFGSPPVRHARALMFEEAI
ncbi:MAG: DUF885 family protein [Alphaproteobacteria bacterium]|nr:DUF885 family protein [Alphaproteobacteria bacterium]